MFFFELVRAIKRAFIVGAIGIVLLMSIGWIMAMVMALAGM